MVVLQQSCACCGFIPIRQETLFESGTLRPHIVTSCPLCQYATNAPLREKRKWRPPSDEQIRLEREMKQALKSLHFPGGNKPSQTEQAHVAQALADILQQAQGLGRQHAGGKTTEGIAWGNKGNPLASAWNIVTNFVDRIVSWFAGQDPEDISDEDIEQEVEDAAGIVGGNEIDSQFWDGVLGGLEDQGIGQIIWVTDGNPCPTCQDNEAQGAIPLGSSFQSGDSKPPAHVHCKCRIDWQ